MYTGAVVGLLVLRVGLPEWPPFLALVNSLAPLLFVPLPGVSLVALGLRAKSILLAGALLLVLFVGLYGARFWPRSGRPECGARQTLRVMTFNLGAHLGQPDPVGPPRFIVSKGNAKHG